MAGLAHPKRCFACHCALLIAYLPQYCHIVTNWTGSCGLRNAFTSPLEGDAQSTRGRGISAPFKTPSAATKSAGAQAKQSRATTYHLGRATCEAGAAQGPAGHDDDT